VAKVTGPWTLPKPTALVSKPPILIKSRCGRFSHESYRRAKFIKVNSLIDSAFPVRSGVANSDILKSYLALLCLGKNDFDAIENFRANAFFIRALGLANVPSSPTLRQRMDTHAASWFDQVVQHQHIKLSEHSLIYRLSAPGMAAARGRAVAVS
jgi:hypothetical protein